MVGGCLNSRVGAEGSFAILEGVALVCGVEYSYQKRSGGTEIVVEGLFA
jgi:hypothetical protein